MNGPITREYLQGLQELSRRQVIDRYIHEFANTVTCMAKEGKTSCVIDIYSNKYQQNRPMMNTNVKFPSIDEFIAGFKRMFPDCSVSYQEAWHDTKTNVRELKKGILVDWS